MSKINDKASRFLGKSLTDYTTQYNPELLVPIERSINRTEHNITEDLVGYDIWHNYECSFLTDKGLPLTVVGKIKIPCSSKYFIESKSMKLYFFSYNMERLGPDPESATQRFKDWVQRDLSLKTQSQVEFEVFKDPYILKECFMDYQRPRINTNNLEFTVFKETPQLLQKSDLKEYKIYFSNLRSNCRVTHQPDFASMYLWMKSEANPTLESILEYIVSFRNEYHFHEEVTEQIYNNLYRMFNPEFLALSLRFTRRGGLDINPVRATDLKYLDYDFLDCKTLCTRTLNQ